MKKLTTILSCSAVLLLLGTSSAAAEEANGGSYTSNGQITFTPNLDPTNPVDPTNPDPDNPITPIDPTDPDGPQPGTNGPLSIDFASSLSFGTQKITSSTETYFAAAQMYTSVEDDVTVEKTGPNFVQVTDNRGTESGWTLNVSQEGQFKNGTKELTGAVIRLKNGAVVTASDSPSPSNAPSQIILNSAGATSLVMGAKANEGAGTYLMAWGTADTAASSIELEVPGSTTKYAGTYTTTFEWRLTDTPSN